MTVQLPILIGLHRSFFLRRSFLLFAVLAVGAVAALPVPLVWRITALLLVVPAAILGWRRLDPAFGSLRLERDGSISVAVGEAGDFVVARCLPGVLCHPRLCVIRLRLASGRIQPLVLAPDSMSTAEFRRLRVFLRWRAAFSDSPSAMA